MLINILLLSLLLSPVAVFGNKTALIMRGIIVWCSHSMCYGVQFIHYGDVFLGVTGPSRELYRFPSDLTRIVAWEVKLPKRELALSTKYFNSALCKADEFWRVASAIGQSKLDKEPCFSFKDISCQ